MSTSRSSRTVGATALAVAGVLTAAVLSGSTAATAAPAHHGTGSGSGTGSGAASLKVVATGLHNPRGVTALADGTVLVAESGMVASNCASGASCVGPAGSVYRIHGHQQGRVVTGLPSWGLGSGDPAKPATGTGPTSVQSDGHGGYVILSGFGGDGSTDFRASLGPSARSLGTIYHTRGHAVVGDLVRHETLQDPDWVLGHQLDDTVESNPWRLARTWDGGYLVTDAAGNDVVRVNAFGQTSTETVLPDVPVPGGGTAQAVPTGIVQGPDGAYYIAELGGLQTGASQIWRLVPGHKPTLFASGFTALIDLAIDAHGDLLALSYTGGFGATGPTPGSLQRIDLHTAKATPVTTDGDLATPTALAVGPGNRIYVAEGADSGNAQLVQLTD